MSDMSQFDNKEFDWLMQAAKEGDYANERVIKHQLRALWTTYCLHHNVDVDTKEYDEKLRVIFNTLSENSMKGEALRFRGLRPVHGGLPELRGKTPTSIK